MLLLGYASRPAGPLLGLPERPMDEESGVLIDSNGNGGESNNWRWAVQRGDGPVWWDIETMRKSTAPNEPSPMTLNAWMERPKVIGIVRARLLDEDSPWPLGVGSWFLHYRLDFGQIYLKCCEMAKYQLVMRVIQDL